jgi:YihY family inner membrane protein
VLGAIVGLITLLTVTTALSAWAKTYSDSVLGILSVEQALGLAFSSITTVAFLFVLYRYVPNTPVTSREVLPGVLFATVTLQVGFFALPLYLDAIDTVASLKALGGIVVLLVWFFLMANILLLGAEINWWYGRGRYGTGPVASEPSDDPRAG